MSVSISYDSTFDGFLSVVFEIYEQHLDVIEICPDRLQSACDIFSAPFCIATSLEHASRLKRAIVNSAGSDILDLLNVAFCSEEVGIEMKLFAYLRKLFAKKSKRSELCKSKNVRCIVHSSGVSDYARNPISDEMLPIYKAARSVRREMSDMLGMVRFSKSTCGIYFAVIEPKYDILPMMIGHFRVRFANESWAIYDASRNYGVFYDTKKCDEIFIDNIDAIKNATSVDNITKLWREYYNAIAIKERDNPKLLKRCLPVRYWKHLPERNYVCA